MIDLSNVALVLDIDGVIRDVSGSYRRALADTVEHFTDGEYRPSAEDIDVLKAEGIWNNDWEASQELIDRHFAYTGEKTGGFDYDAIVEFFQSRYRGTDPHNWTGYISQEPLIATAEYFQSLTAAGIAWGFFSGATRGSALYVLRRLGVDSSILVAMEDAPGKPNPTGLIVAAEQLGDRSSVVYVGDTVADMLAVLQARKTDTSRRYVGVGVIPPHVPIANRDSYTKMLQSVSLSDKLNAGGTSLVLQSILDLTPDLIRQVIVD